MTTKAAKPKMSEEELEQEYLAEMSTAHLFAASVVREVLNVDETAENYFFLADQVFDTVVYLDDDGALEEESSEEAKADLVKAKVWLETTYPKHVTPTNILKAYARLFDDEDAVSNEDIMEKLEEIEDGLDGDNE